jgi:3-isopropylmalate/(R)-2-methylmalate dehydratase small subunit
MSLVPLVGNAWIFGDNVDTDSIYPGRFLHILDRKEIAKHAFEYLKPDFVKKVEPLDVIIAGRNFGCGSSREHAVLTLKHNGIGAVIALSYGRIFYRNAINNALPVITFDMDEKEIVALYSSVFDGDEVDLEFGENRLEIVNSGERFNLKPIPEHLLKIINDGGLIEQLKQRFQK